jgi:hypothetical protein
MNALRWLRRLFRRRRARPAGVVLALKRPKDSLRFSIGDLVDWDDPVTLLHLQAPVAVAFLGSHDVVVVDIDHVRGLVTVASRC